MMSEKVWALVDGETIINVVVGGTPEWFAEHEDYKAYTVIDVTDMEEKPSPSGWFYKDGEFGKEPMPDPLPPMELEENVEVEIPEIKPGLNPEK